ncbi:MAG: 30S ribosomal protein S6 [Oscillospiraceae bacterium]|jgi:small subunit ribosomal protein S6|nr:30S ribosomal protein S6 [Oscillospiraceae bacterium]
MAANNYEAMVVFSMKGGEDSVNALKDRFQSLVEQNGTLTELKEWGKRFLKYPINKETEGYYVLYLFAAPPEFPAEFLRVTGITDGVLRALVTRQGE